VYQDKTANVKHEAHDAPGISEGPNDVGAIAPLRNVSLFMEGLATAVHRPLHLPGLVVFHGPSGYGKTWSAIRGAHAYRAHYLELRSVWTARGLAIAICRELGVQPKASAKIYDMVELICEELRASRKPLILDEADHLLKQQSIELVRDILEESRCPVVLIGEERLPEKLRAWERMHNRVVAWVSAVPCDADDARALARLHHPDCRFAPELLDAIVAASQNGARRICTNLHLVATEAANEGRDAVLDLAWWGARRFFDPNPRPRMLGASKGGR
jgi:hypothetical protein